MIVGVLRRTAHGELIHVEFAEDDRILRLDFRHDCRIIRRHEMFKDLGCTGRFDPLGADIVLDSARDTFEEGNRFALGNLFIDSLGLSQCLIARNGQICLDVALDFIDAL